MSVKKPNAAASPTVSPPADTRQRAGSALTPADRARATSLFESGGRQRTVSVLEPGRTEAFFDNRSRAGSTLDGGWDVVGSTTRFNLAKEAAETGGDIFGTRDWPVDRIAVLRTALTVAPWHDTQFQLKTVANVMSGAEFAQWLRAQNFAGSLAEAVEVGNALFAREMIFPMRKTLRDKMFQASPELFYSLDVDRKEKLSLRSIAQAAVRTNNVVDALTSKAPSLVIKTVDYTSRGGEATEARVQERQRRSGGGVAADGRWTTDKLLKTDPKPWSMRLDDVPVPAVGDASPDGCDWLTDWEVEVTPGRTDEEGWMYLPHFQHTEPLTAPDTTSCVRLRVWSRIAQKARLNTISTASGAAGGAGALNGAELYDDGSSREPLSVEEQAHRDLMNRTAAALRRPPRFGVLEFTVMHGRAITCARTSFVEVEFAGKTFRSEESLGHKWDLSNHDTMGDLNSCALIVRVFRPATIGKPTLIGQAEFVAPEREAAGIRYLPLHGGLVGDYIAKGKARACGTALMTADRGSETTVQSPTQGASSPKEGSGTTKPPRRGHKSTTTIDPAVGIMWCFKPRRGGVNGDDVSSMISGTTGTHLPLSVSPSLAFVPTPVATQECALHLQIISADDLLINLDRQMTRGQRVMNDLACACCLRNAGSSSKLLVAVRYRGRYIDSVCRSPPVPLKRNAEWRWKVSIQVNHEWPVTLEVVRVTDDVQTVIGQCVFVFERANRTIAKTINLSIPPGVSLQDAEEQLAKLHDEDNKKPGFFAKIFSSRTVDTSAPNSFVNAPPREQRIAADVEERLITEVPDVEPLVFDGTNSERHDDDDTAGGAAAVGDLDPTGSGARTPQRSTVAGSLEAGSQGPRRRLVVGRLTAEWTFEIEGPAGADTADAADSLYY